MAVKKGTQYQIATQQMVSDILITVFLVFVNGFFVAAEFAIVKVRLPLVQARSEKSAKARIAEDIVSHLDSYISAIQLGITLSSIGLGWISLRIILRELQGIVEALQFSISDDVVSFVALLLVFSFVTALHFIFGELIPKSLAIRHPMRTTMGVAVPLRSFYIVARPFLWVFNGIASMVLRIVGVDRIQHEVVHTEEELKMIIAESAEGGAIEPSERELIQNVFDFDDRFVWQILQPRTQIAAIDVETELDEAIEYALEEGYSRFPVYEESIDNILGFVHTKDLLMLARQKNARKAIRDIIRPILYVSSNKKVMQLLRQFQKEHEQLAVVVNEFGGTVGLVTLEDIIEELVGEIQDEYDTEIPIVEKTGENTFTILAQNPLDEINELVPFPFSEADEYHTLSGLLLKVSDKIPDEGEIIQVDNYEVKILKMFQASPELVEAVYEPLREKPEPKEGE